MKEFGNNMATWIITTGLGLVLGIARISQMFAKHSNKDALQQRDIDELKSEAKKVEKRTFDFNRDVGVILTENKHLKEQYATAKEEIEKLKAQMNEFDKRFIKLEK